MKEECTHTSNLVALEFRAVCKTKYTKLRVQFYSDHYNGGTFINEKCLKEKKWPAVL